jgi:hypothetical protein
MVHQAPGLISFHVSVPRKASECRTQKRLKDEFQDSRRSCTTVSFFTDTFMMFSYMFGAANAGIANSAGGEVVLWWRIKGRCIPCLTVRYRYKRVRLFHGFSHFWRTSLNVFPTTFICWGPFLIFKNYVGKIEPTTQNLANHAAGTPVWSLEG